MTTKTKHPLTEVMQWIIDGEVVEQRSSSSSWVWHVLDVTENFSLFHNSEYRKKKKKPPIVRYRWVFEDDRLPKDHQNRFGVTSSQYRDYEEFMHRNPIYGRHFKFLSFISESKIEVEQ